MSHLVILGRLYKWWGRSDVLTLSVIKLHLLIAQPSLRVGSTP